MSTLYVTYPQGGGGGTTGSQVGVPYIIGPLDGAAASANGGVIGSNAFYFQTATTVNPGLVSSGNQTFAGVKTFNVAPQFSSLSPSAPLKTDGSSNVTVGSISLTADVTGQLPITQTSGSVSLVNKVTGNLPLSQTSGSISLTNQVSGNLPLSQTQGSLSLVNQVVGNLPLSQTSGSISLVNQVSGNLPISQTSGSVSLVNQVVGNLPLSQTSGSISLTNQVVGTLLTDSPSVFSIGTASNASGRRPFNIYAEKGVYVGNYPSSASSAHMVLSSNLGIGPNPSLIMYSGGAQGYQLTTDGSTVFFANTGQATRVFIVSDHYFHGTDVTTGLNYITGSSTALTLRKIPLTLSGSTSSGGISHIADDNSTSYTVQWPTSQGSASWTLQNNGVGSLSWVSSLSNPMRNVGDMIVGGATGAPAQLSVGSSTMGYVLSQNGVPTPSWSRPNFFQNLISNSGFDCWQAGVISSVSWTNGTTTSNYVADQFYTYNALGGTITNGVISCSMSASTLVGCSREAHIFVSTEPVSSPATGNVCELWGILDSGISAQLNFGSSFCLGVPVKSKGNVTQVGVSIYRGAAALGAETRLTSSASTIVGSETLFSVNSATYVICSMTNNVGASVTNAYYAYRIRVSAVSSGSTYNLTNGYATTQHQLNVGPALAPWTRKTPSVSGEFLDCQQWYEKTFDPDVGPAQLGGAVAGGFFVGSTNGSLREYAYLLNTAFNALWGFKVYKNKTPAITTYSTNAATANWSLNGDTPTATVTTIGRGGLAIIGGTASSAGNAYTIHAVADARI